MAESPVNSSETTSSNFNDPYFLHHSDNPGMILVSQPLTGDNYNSWSRSMLIAPSVKNKVGFIDGSIPKPINTDINSNMMWNRNNNMVISWILNSVSKEISASIIFVESAYEIWNDLKIRFEQSNGPRIFQIRRDLMNLTQNQDSISVYFTKLNSLWEELANFRPACTCNKCVCGGVKNMHDYIQSEYSMGFLMGLNDSYTQIRGQILLMDPLPPLNRIFSLLIQEEKQRSIGGNNDQPVAFNVNKTVQGNKNGAKNRPFCTHCKRPGHTIEKCYKIHGYPPGYKSSPKVNNVLADSQTDQNSNSQIEEVVCSFTKDQCQKLMAALSSHLTSVNMTTSATYSDENSGGNKQEDDWQG